MRIELEDCINYRFRDIELNKKAAVMQLYMFPYLGYFQLIAAVDVFVLGDDYQYVNRSWMNRNRILVNEKDKLITFPLKKSGQRSKINEKILSDNFVEQANKVLQVIADAYAKAPCYQTVFPFVKEIIECEERNFAKYAENSIRKICGYLDISTPLILASDLNVDDPVDMHDKVIRQVKKMGANVYINPIGGQNLYDPSYFDAHDIQLKFHKMDDIEYAQNGITHVPSLSIIDVLMFNEVSEVKKKLSCYSLQDKYGHPA